MQNEYPSCRKDNICMQELNSEILIYDLNTNKAICLNQTSALVWKACDGNKSLTEISNELSKKLNTSIDEGLVWLTLEQLKKENLIEGKAEIPLEFKGMSRRELIKKIGIVTTIALPMISSLISPTAANAASGSTCTSGAAPNGAAGSGGFCRCVFPGTPLGATCGVGDAAFSLGETCKPGCICTHSNFGNGTCG